MTIRDRIKELRRVRAGDLLFDVIPRFSRRYAADNPDQQAKV